MPQAVIYESVLRNNITQAEQNVKTISKKDLYQLATSQSALEQLPVRMALAYIGYDDVSWANAQEVLRAGNTLLDEVLSMEGDKFLTRRSIAAISSLGRVEPAAVETYSVAAHALAVYLEACLLSAGNALGLRTPTTTASAIERGILPPAWPIKVDFREIMKAVDEAALWGRTPLVVCSGHAQEADTFFNYRGFASIDAKWILKQVFLDKEMTVEDMQKVLQQQLVESMKCCLPLHIAMSSSALDFKGQLCRDGFFPSSLFNTAMFRRPLEYKKVLSDDARKGWAMDITERMAKEFFMLVTTDMDMESARAHLPVALPYFNNMAIIEIDTASFEADRLASEARKRERQEAKFGSNSMG